MAVIRDVMPAFELLQPSSAADAQRLLEQHKEDAWVMAGGLDSFDWLKDRIKKPKVLVDLSGIEELKGVRSTGDGIEIGSMTTLTEIANHPVIKQKYGVLAEAVSLVASPQIRNQGTLGGNVSQDTRCWYYRGGWPCYRAGGNICYADTPVGRNREHAIFDAERCVAVSPSDSAPALIALDAKFVMRTAKGERTVNAEDYFLGPDDRHHAHEHTAAWRPVDGDSHTWGLGGVEVLFREGAGPQCLGLSFDERGLGDGAVGQYHQPDADCGQCSGGAAAAAEGGRGCGPRPTGECGDGRDGGQAGGGRSGSVAVQRLQDPADEESG